MHKWTIGRHCQFQVMAFRHQPISSGGGDGGGGVVVCVGWCVGWCVGVEGVG